MSTTLKEGKAIYPNWLVIESHIYRVNGVHICIMVRVFANDSGDRANSLDASYQRLQKMALDVSLTDQG